MRIGEKPPIGLEDYIRQQLRGVTEKVRAEREDRAHRVRGQGEKVAISQEAQELVELLRRAKEIPEVRMELVRRLREAIQKGTYEVSSRDVATKMILESLYEVLGR
ncbi:MAG: flagellar biosynthesis anti-sigma factor FlgM [Deltaproteobacteria bacterium]|nr:MAG: flagellar biosynthesis anti-sigma factor FlgM [Deltaproteobacteria bacterium]